MCYNNPHFVNAFLVLVLALILNLVYVGYKKMIFEREFLTFYLIAYLQVVSFSLRLSYLDIWYNKEL
jgi:hypothetical protein